MAELAVNTEEENNQISTIPEQIKESQQTLKTGVLGLDQSPYSGLDQFKRFWLFGYGSGAFSQIFKIFYIVPESLSTHILAEHAHNDGIELLGEIGGANKQLLKT